MQIMEDPSQPETDISSLTAVAKAYAKFCWWWIQHGHDTWLSPVTMDNSSSISHLMCLPWNKIVCIFITDEEACEIKLKLIHWEPTPQYTFNNSKVPSSEVRFQPKFLGLLCWSERPTAGRANLRLSLKWSLRWDPYLHEHRSAVRTLGWFVWVRFGRRRR